MNKWIFFFSKWFIWKNFRYMDIINLCYVSCNSYEY